VILIKLIDTEEISGYYSPPPDPGFKKPDLTSLHWIFLDS
jgi:hypothetical protein